MALAIVMGYFDLLISGWWEEERLLPLMHKSHWHFLVQQSNFCHFLHFYNPLLLRLSCTLYLHTRPSYDSLQYWAKQSCLFGVHYGYLQCMQQVCGWFCLNTTIVNYRHKEWNWFDEDLSNWNVQICALSNWNVQTMFFKYCKFVV